MCGLAALFYVYDYFIQVAPSVMTHQLMRSFSIDAAGLGILGASFFYSYTLMQIPAGLLIDRFGVRVILTFAVLLSACGVIVFGTAHYFAWAAFARFLVGIGSSFAFISAIFLVARWFPHRHFALMAGFIQLAACVGSVIGEAPLALTAQRTSKSHVHQTGKSRASVTNMLRLLKLNSDVRSLVEQGQLDMGHARALLALDGLQQSEVAKGVVARALSVRETEKLIRQLLSSKGEKTSLKTLDPDVARLQSDLSDKIGAVVIIRHNNKGKGRLIIHYNSVDELEGILDRIK